MAQVAFKTSELNELIKNSDSGVTLVPKCTKQIVLTFYQLSNLQQYMKEYLYSSVAKYDSELDAIVLSYKKVAIEDIFTIRNDGKTKVWYTADIYAFKPKIGSVLSGIINKKSDDHVGCLVHRVFNIAIPRPSNQEQLSWIGSKLKIGQEVQFKVVEVELNDDMPYIKAELIDQTGLTFDDNVNDNSPKNETKEQTDGFTIPKDTDEQESSLREKSLKSSHKKYESAYVPENTDEHLDGWENSFSDKSFVSNKTHSKKHEKRKSKNHETTKITENTDERVSEWNSSIRDKSFVSNKSHSKNCEQQESTSLVGCAISDTELDKTSENISFNIGTCNVSSSKKQEKRKANYDCSTPINENSLNTSGGKSADKYQKQKSIVSNTLNNMYLMLSRKDTDKVCDNKSDETREKKKKHSKKENQQGRELNECNIDRPNNENNRKIRKKCLTDIEDFEPEEPDDRSVHNKSKNSSKLHKKDRYSLSELDTQLNDTSIKKHKKKRNKSLSEITDSHQVFQQSSSKDNLFTTSNTSKSSRKKCLTDIEDFEPEELDDRSVYNKSESSSKLHKKNRYSLSELDTQLNYTSIKEHKKKRNKSLGEITDSHQVFQQSSSKDNLFATSNTSKSSRKKYVTDIEDFEPSEINYKSEPESKFHQKNRYSLTEQDIQSNHNSIKKHKKKRNKSLGAIPDSYDVTQQTCEGNLLVTPSRPKDYDESYKSKRKLKHMFNKTEDYTDCEPQKQRRNSEDKHNYHTGYEFVKRKKKKNKYGIETNTNDFRLSADNTLGSMIDTECMKKKKKHKKSDKKFDVDTIRQNLLESVFSEFKKSKKNIKTDEKDRTKKHKHKSTLNGDSNATYTSTEKVHTDKLLSKKRKRTNSENVTDEDSFQKKKKRKKSSVIENHIDDLHTSDTHKKKRNDKLKTTVEYLSDSLSHLSDSSVLKKKSKHKKEKLNSTDNSTFIDDSFSNSHSSTKKHKKKKKKSKDRFH